MSSNENPDTCKIRDAYRSWLTLNWFPSPTIRGFRYFPRAEDIVRPIRRHFDVLITERSGFQLTLDASRLQDLGVPRCRSLR